MTSDPNDIPTLEEFRATRVYWPDLADAPQCDDEGPGYQYEESCIICENDDDNGEKVYWVPLNDGDCTGTLEECEEALYEWAYPTKS
jgi:hypothetical protein